jgi:hypothetical protein
VSVEQGFRSRTLLAGTHRPPVHSHAQTPPNRSQGVSRPTKRAHGIPGAEQPQAATRQKPKPPPQR